MKRRHFLKTISTGVCIPFTSVFKPKIHRDLAERVEPWHLPKVPEYFRIIYDCIYSIQYSNGTGFFTKGRGCDISDLFLKPFENEDLKVSNTINAFCITPKEHCTIEISSIMWDDKKVIETFRPANSNGFKPKIKYGTIFRNTFDF